MGAIPHLGVNHEVMWWVVEGAGTAEGHIESQRTSQLDLQSIKSKARLVQVQILCKIRKWF